jgi:hypothetical protein
MLSIVWGKEGVKTKKTCNFLLKINQGNLKGNLHQPIMSTNLWLLQKFS